MEDDDYDDIVVYDSFLWRIWKTDWVCIPGILEHHEGDACYRIPACYINGLIVWRVDIYCTSDTYSCRAGKSFQPRMN